MWSGLEDTAIPPPVRGIHDPLAPLTDRVALATIRTMDTASLSPRSSPTLAAGVALAFSVALLAWSDAKAQDVAPLPDMPEVGEGAAPKTDSIQRLIPEQLATDEDVESRVDRLYERLAEAPNKERAETIANSIRRLQSRSGSPTVDLLMVQASRALETKDYATALDISDAVVRLAPDFAEGWNRRATIHYLREDFGKSLEDIAVVLSIEPRHWGALTGLAMILAAADRHDEALAAADQALAIHPYLEELQERRDKLAEEVRGDDI